MPPAHRQFVVAEPERRKREVLPVHKAARAVLRVRRGWPIKHACAASGIPMATWYAWLKADDGWPSGEQPSPAAQMFAARLRRAFARAQAQAAGNAAESVYSARNKAQGEVDWRAGHEWLKHADARKDWHEYRELKVEQTGTVSHEHRLAVKMDRDQLTDCIDDPEWRELLEEGQSGR